MPELFLPGRADQKALSPHPQGVFTRILGLDAQALQWRETLLPCLYGCKNDVGDPEQ